MAVNLASSLAESGLRTGLLDIDVHGPSGSRLLGLEGQKIMGSAEKPFPWNTGIGIKVVSVGFFPGRTTRSSGGVPLNRRHRCSSPTSSGANLDYLIVDSPPGTGDEPLSICQLVKDPHGAVIVTTPQDVAIIDVRKSISSAASSIFPYSGSSRT